MRLRRARLCRGSGAIVALAVLSLTTSAAATEKVPFSPFDLAQGSIEFSQTEKGKKLEAIPAQVVDADGKAPLGQCTSVTIEEGFITSAGAGTCPALWGMNPLRPAAIMLAGGGPPSVRALEPLSVARIGRPTRATLIR